ncbi:MAG: sensor histidine kinase [Eubacterium sp.]
MRLFWKMFLSIISIITIIFSIFGGLLLKMSFDTALNREFGRGQNENQMFLYAFENSIEMVSDEEAPDNNDIKKIVESIKKSIGQNQFYVRIYNYADEIVYEDDTIKSHISKNDIKDGKHAYVVSQDDGIHYMEFMSKILISKNSYYIDTIRNIQYVYDDREEMAKRYSMILAAILVVASILSYVLSTRITKPITRLSDTVQKMALGDYTIRAELKAAGEVGTLVENFNGMAGKLEENIAELEDTARRQEDFIASFAHELKTPLTSIVGYSDMLRSMDLDEKEINEYSNYIFQQGKRLEKLSYTLMNLISLDKQEIKFVKINVRKLFQSISLTMSPALRDRNIKFVTDIEEDYVMGDVDLLYSLFFNLIDNGRKAIEKDGMILVKGRKYEKNYKILVKDDGCGMEKEEIKKITEAFYMIDKSRARKEGGAGIGMALCKKIINLHNAKWSIKSKPGKGTVVNVSFNRAG